MKSVYSYYKRDTGYSFFYVICRNNNPTGMELPYESLAKKYCNERNK